MSASRIDRARALEISRLTKDLKHTIDPSQLNSLVDQFEDRIPSGKTIADLESLIIEMHGDSDQIDQAIKLWNEGLKESEWTTVSKKKRSDQKDVPNKQKKVDSNQFRHPKHKTEEVLQSEKKRYRPLNRTENGPSEAIQKVHQKKEPQNHLKNPKTKAPSPVKEISSPVTESTSPQRNTNSQQNKNNSRWEKKQGGAHTQQWGGPNKQRFKRVEQEGLDSSQQTNQNTRQQTKQNLSEITHDQNKNVQTESENVKSEQSYHEETVEVQAAAKEQTNLSPELIHESHDLNQTLKSKTHQTKNKKNQSANRTKLHKQRVVSSHWVPRIQSAQSTEQVSFPEEKELIFDAPQQELIPEVQQVSNEAIVESPVHFGRWGFTSPEEDAIEFQFGAISEDENFVESTESQLDLQKNSHEDKIDETSTKQDLSLNESFCSSPTPQIDAISSNQTETSNEEENIESFQSEVQFESLTLDQTNSARVDDYEVNYGDDNLNEKQMDNSIESKQIETQTTIKNYQYQEQQDHGSTNRNKIVNNPPILKPLRQYQPYPPHPHSGYMGQYYQPNMDMYPYYPSQSPAFPPNFYYSPYFPHNTNPHNYTLLPFSQFSDMQNYNTTQTPNPYPSEMYQQEYSNEAKQFSNPSSSVPIHNMNTTNSFPNYNQLGNSSTENPSKPENTVWMRKTPQNPLNNETAEYGSHPNNSIRLIGNNNPHINSHHPRNFSHQHSSGIYYPKKSREQINRVNKKQHGQLNQPSHHM